MVSRIKIVSGLTGTGSVEFFEMQVIPRFVRLIDAQGCNRVERTEFFSTFSLLIHQREAEVLESK